MEFSFSPASQARIARVRAFMREEVEPAASTYASELAQDRWRLPPIVEQLKRRAKVAGLWNLFLPRSEHHAWAGEGLSNLDYAPLAEEMGRVLWASEVFNCSAPDTGNMEVLLRYGTQAQQEKWLQPMLDGSMRSAYAMTEPEVASSDATNVQTRIERRGDTYVLNGRKWWISGVLDPRCKVMIVMGKSDPRAPKHQQQTQILVPIDAKGVEIGRMLPVLGYDDAPHGHAEVTFRDTVVPAENVILGEGRGFEISQGRLGPGRIHHCMRTIGLAEAAIEKMARRLMSRETFGKKLSERSVWEQRIAEARTDIEMTRLLTLKAAYMMDKVGAKGARAEIAMIKVAGPRLALKLIDDAIQAHGAGGLTTDFGLAAMYARVRGLRIADGPDEVHNRTIAKLEFKRHADPAS